MKKVNLEELVSPKDKLTDSIEMIKGGVASEGCLCWTGCKTGTLKKKKKGNGQGPPVKPPSTEPKPHQPSPNDSTTVHNP